MEKPKVKVITLPKVKVKKVTKKDKWIAKNYPTGPAWTGD